MSGILWLIIGVVVFILAVIIIIYNRLIVLKVRTNEAWSQIDVQLKKRNDLVPNLVETVKGYAAHEKTAFESVAKARAMMQNAGSDVGKTIEANNILTNALKSLFAVVENYPELKANQNFLTLQMELAGIEEKIAYARQFYNECVRMYNEYQQQFPVVLFTKMFGHQNREFFEISEEEKKAPQIKF